MPTRATTPTSTRADTCAGTLLTSFPTAQSISAERSDSLFSTSCACQTRLMALGGSYWTRKTKTTKETR